MATKIKAANEFVRQDTLRLHPDDVLPGRNSRMRQTPDYQDKVIRKAISIFHEGQTTPGLGHRNKDLQVVLDDGFTRYDAVKLLRQGFTAPDPEDAAKFITYHKPDLTYWIYVDTGVKTDEEAFVKSALSNQHRDDTTDVQEALAQRVFRDEFKWSDAKIAREYGYTNQNRVGALKKLLALPDFVIDLVHAGNLALHAALDTFDLQPTQRETVIREATDTNTGRVDGARIRKLIRDLYSAGDGEITGTVPSDAQGTTDADLQPAEAANVGVFTLSSGGGSAKPAQSNEGNTISSGGKPNSQTDNSGGGKSIARTVKDIKAFASEVLDENTAVSPKAKELFGVFLRWVNGELKTDRQLWAAIEAVK